jgi:hypothetical protein
MMPNMQIQEKPAHEKPSTQVKTILVLLSLFGGRAWLKAVPASDG